MHPNPHKPGTPEHSITANHLELIECIKDYLNECTDHSAEELRKTILHMIEGHTCIHEDIHKGEL